MESPGRTESSYSSLQVGDVESGSETTKADGITTFQVAANFVKAVLGAGSFALPWAFMQAGLVLGPVVLILTTFISAYTLGQLTHCYDLTKKANDLNKANTLLLENQGDAPLKYTDVAREVFGPIGAASVYIATVLISIAAGGAYLVFISETLFDLFPVLYSQAVIVAILVPFVILLSMVRDFKKLSFTSMLGNVSVTAGMIVVAVYAALYADPPSIDDISFFKLDTFGKSFGSISFLFNIQFLSLPIYSSAAKKERFGLAILMAFAFAVLVSVAFGCFCYLQFGDATRDIVILNVTGSWFLKSVKMLLCVDLLFTYPLALRPSFEILEASLPRFMFRDFWRILLVLGTITAAMTIPKFAILSGLAGGVCQAFLGFVLPPAMVTWRRWRKIGCMKLALNLTIILLGFFMMLWSVWSTAA